MDDKSSSDSNNNDSALRLASNGNHGNSSNHFRNLNNNSGSAGGGETKNVEFTTVTTTTENGGQSEDDSDDTIPDDSQGWENPTVEFPGSEGHAAGSKQAHNERYVNQCTLCGKKCAKQSELQRHLVYHLGKKPFKCTDCGKRFQVKNNMLLHQRAAHGDRYNHEFLECPSGVLGPSPSTAAEMPALCATEPASDNMYPNGGDTSPAPSNHSPASPGNDDADDYSLEYPTVFPGLKHQLQVRNETVLVTRLDGLNKTTKERLSLFKCHMCGKIFNFLSKLQCHLSTHFERTLSVFVCTYCDAHFPLKTQLTQHLRRSHEVNISSKDDILDMTELDSAATSPKASPAGGSTDGDDRSGEKVHYHTEALYSKVNGLYVCQFCNKGFDRLFSLSRHERIHTGFKPCYCKYCGRGFSEPRNLRHHMIRFHSEAGDANKRLRRGYGRSPWRVNRRVSHSSQRLAYVPPEIVARETSRKDNKENSPKSDHRSGSESPGPQPIIIQPTGEGGTAKLASEIREKEKLDEDVTVVIPSDGPIPGPDPSKEPDRTTPRSVCSDHTNWSATEVSEPEASDTIMSAPIKSLIGHHSKSRRKTSFTATTPTPGDGGYPHCGMDEEPDEPPDIKPALCDTSTENTLHNAVSAALSLPFNPLNISTYMTPGLGGLLPSPLISPLNQAAFFAQQGLTSPSMVPNPLSFFPPLPNPVPPPPVSLVSTATTPTKDSSSPHDNKSAAHSPTPMSTDAATAGANRGSLDDLQSWMSKGGSRGSALSRSHSSRLYVVRQPVKREDACKPVVLPDGRTVYRCTYCNKDFCTFSDVNRHMDFHEGGFSLRDRRHGSRSTADSPAFLQDIRPYKCKFCDYYARTNSQLKVHMMRHQGIREFHCKLCNYKGVTQSDLNRHMKSQIHMMKAQNECKHCGEGFVSPKNLERHYHEKHFSQYEKMATSHAAAAAAAAAAVHAGKLGPTPGYQGNA